MKGLVNPRGSRHSERKAPTRVNRCRTEANDDDEIVLIKTCFDVLNAVEVCFVCATMSYCQAMLEGD